MSNNGNLTKNSELHHGKGSMDPDKDPDNDLNFEFRYKNDKFLTKKLINRIETLSFDIPKDEKITAMFCDLQWDDSTPFFVIYLIPLIFSMSMMIPGFLIDGMSIISLFILPLGLLLSYIIIILITKTRPFKILLFTEKSINSIHLFRSGSFHKYIPYDRISFLAIDKNTISIEDKNKKAYIKFSMNYNKNTFLKTVRELIYNHLGENSLVEYENDIIKTRVEDLKEKIETSKSGKFAEKNRKKRFKEIEGLSVPIKIGLHNYNSNENSVKLIKKKIRSSKTTIIVSILIVIPIIVLITIFFSSSLTVMIMTFIIGPLILGVFIIISIQEYHRLTNFTNSDKSTIRILEDGLEIINNDNKDLGGVIKVPFKTDMIIKPYGYINPSYSKYSINYNTIDILRWLHPQYKIKIGKIENIRDFYNNLYIAYFKWYKSTQGDKILSTDEIFNKFIHTDDFNKKLYNTMKQSIQNFLCDVKRSTYRFNRIESIMKTVNLTDIDEIKKPLKKLEDLPEIIEIPEGVINPDCGSESEGDKIRTRDLLEWSLIYPKEFYQFYINDDEKILFAYHPSSNIKIGTFVKRIVVLVTLFFISTYSVYLLSDEIVSALFLTTILFLCPIFKIFTGIDTYKREIIFTDKKILNLSYMNLYFTTYTNIEKASKYHQKSDKILKKLVLSLKTNATSTTNINIHSINIKKLPLNSPIFAILSKKGVSLYRSD
ncbi:hypothetical protein DSAG12_03888 [Promethearchaeum syntrophicum]|uniref:Uncharacterized protein n=1 Tax=Promethearchaeum syntrophicum TaxID=2594042 RepID=A0A5B9DH23_9ARCH|nr:hypothetical protein [Candidatus Prometheoarchaeum syntrophicum]QEE18050.1 hypothetical protein DSAG12_03888 [Candidatus Prometheoarchaeum syntrophicum]